MARFITELDVSLVAEGLWRLNSPLSYYSDVVSSLIVVPEGFTTDFASVPRVPFAYLLTGGIGHRAAALHDYLYRTGLYSRAVCDAIFYEALRVEGVSWWRAQLMYLGVRVGGWANYKGQCK